MDAPDGYSGSGVSGAGEHSTSPGLVSLTLCTTQRYSAAGGASAQAVRVTIARTAAVKLPAELNRRLPCRRA